MNYYNPYFYTIPNIATPKVGLLSKIFGGNITFSGILNGTQKALNFANQAIPLVKQVKPMVGNAKTVFKVMNEFKKVELPSTKNNTKSNINNNNTLNIEKNNIQKENINNGPNFFI